MSTEQACPQCGGTGTITVPSIQDKIAVHLMNSPGFGLQLMPPEVAELAQALGLVPADLCVCDGKPPHVHIPDAPP